MTVINDVRYKNRMLDLGLSPKRGSSMEFDKHSYFDTIDTEEKAYWLGFICADGYANNASGRISISLSSKDSGHLKKFADIFGKKVLKHKVYLKNTNKYYDMVCVRVDSKILTDKLLQYGIDNNKTRTLSGNLFTLIPENMHQHFIRGYVDGDGSIFFDKSSNTPKFSVASTKNFLISLQSILIYFCGINKTKIVGKDGGGCYEFVIAGPYHIAPVRDWLYSNATVFLERKRNVFFSIKPRKLKTSKFMGVYKSKACKSWIAQIKPHKKSIYLGSFETETDAALAYDAAAKKYMFPRYKLNFV